MHQQLGIDVPIGPHHRVGQLAFEQGALRIGLTGCAAIGGRGAVVPTRRLELRGLHLADHIKARHIQRAVVQRELGREVIRRGDVTPRLAVVLQHLPIGGSHGQLRGPHRNARLGGCGQQALRQGAGRAGEVSPVVVVAHPVDIHGQRHGPTLDLKLRVLLGRQCPTFTLTQLVVGHELQVHGPFLSRRERLQLTTVEHQAVAPQAHALGRHDQVAIRGNVPVVRGVDGEPVLVVHHHAGWQPARAALARHGESKRGHGQDGQAFEIQRAALDAALVLTLIQRDALGFQKPIGQPLAGLHGLTTGVNGFFQADFFRALKHQALGVTA